MTLGNKLQKLRNENGLSQEQLSEMIPVSRQAISKWELDQSTPELDCLIKLSDFFNVTVDYLVKESINTPNTQVLDDKQNTMRIKKDKSKIAGIIMMSVSFISLMLFWMISLLNPVDYHSDSYNGYKTFKAFLLSSGSTNLFYFCWVIGIIGIILFFMTKLTNYFRGQHTK